MKKPVIIYTDGACLGNPGPGGFGIVILKGKDRKELSGGFRLTTNNRMELMAAIVALEDFNSPHEVFLYSDSRYLIDAFQKGWILKWKSKNWKKSSKEIVPNSDLWKRLLSLFEYHDVTLEWVEGHSGVKENERCDWLSQKAAHNLDNPYDAGYTRPQELQNSLFN